MEQINCGCACLDRRIVGEERAASLVQALVFRVKSR
jgi:hypothetical protein